MASRDYILRDWTASFYHEKKWLYGSLKLGISGLTFTPQNYELQGMRVCIKYSDIDIVKKSRTGVIFNAIVISTKSTEHWISSLKNREVTFNMILYFCKNILTGNPFDSYRSDKNANTGVDLLELVKDSERCLTSTARSLAYQGDQIDNMMKSMEDVHHDLNISRRLLHGMEGWMSKWSTRVHGIRNGQYSVKNNLELTKNKDFVILYSLKNNDSDSNLQFASGLLSLDDKSITILNNKESIIQRYTWTDLSNVKVISPWEIVVTRFLIGQPDVKYEFICVEIIESLPYAIIGSKLVDVIAALNERVQSKVEYCAPKLSDISPPLPTAHNLSQKSALNLRSSISDSFLSLHTNPSTSTSTSTESFQQQLLKDRKTSDLTDADMEEINAGLANLRSLAVTVGEEMNRQNEHFDKLTATVDRANVRMSEQQIFMKKL